MKKNLADEEAKKVASAIEVGFEVIEKKADAVALQKKLELKDELTKELATKADLLLFRQEMETIKVELEKKIETETLRLENKMVTMDRKFTIMFVILFFTIVFLNQNALEFMAKVLGLIK